MAADAPANDLTGAPPEAFDAIGAPPIVAELVGVIGHEAYCRLEAKLGGALIYVPRRPGPDHLLTHAVGARLAGVIGDYFHGQQLLLPVGGWARARSNRAQILALAETMNGDQIAARLKIARSWVYEVLASARLNARADDNGQGKLFG
jgi:hypothetical protein